MIITPFTINIPQQAVDDLRDQLARTRWPDQLPGARWSKGVPVDYLQGLVEYWRSDFDWREQEARLNQFPQFTTEIDGQTIHFMNILSPEPNALPMMMIHGYPSSVVEFMDMIGPLTNPRAYGGRAEDAFHLVIPSLPGFGFSVPVSDAEWELHRTSQAYVELMRRLGYERYVAHGGDIGAGVVGNLGIYDADHIAAAHVITDPTAIALIGMPLPDPADDSTLTEGEKQRLNDLRAYQAEGTGYLQIMSTRPQTLAYALTDSPVGQLTWIIEKFNEWSNIEANLPEDAFDLDQLLTNVSLYWFTRTGATAANFIYEASHSKHGWGPESSAPTGFAAFNVKNVEKMMRQMIDPQAQIEHWSTFSEGGHFPTMEAPDLLVNDIRAYFRQFR